MLSFLEQAYKRQNLVWWEACQTSDHARLLFIINNPKDRNYKLLASFFNCKPATVYTYFNKLNIPRSKKPKECRG